MLFDNYLIYENWCVFSAFGVFQGSLVLSLAEPFSRALGRCERGSLNHWWIFLSESILFCTNAANCIDSSENTTTFFRRMIGIAQVNDRLEIRRMEYFDIDEKARSYHDPTGRGWFRASENVSELVRKRDLMFIERDFVARCLMTVCALKESNAYQAGILQVLM